MLIPLLACAQVVKSNTLVMKAEQFNGVSEMANYVFTTPHQVKIPRIIKLLAGRTSIDFVYFSLDNIVCSYYPIAEEHIFLFKECKTEAGNPLFVDANTWQIASNLKLYFLRLDGRINLKQAEAVIEYKDITYFPSQGK